MSEEISTIEEVKDANTFDLGAFMTQKIKYPTRSESVVLDRDVVLRAHEIAEEFADLDGQFRESVKESATGDPELEEQAEALKAQLEATLAEAEESKLTFVMRGVAPKVWRQFDKALRQKHKVDKNATQDERHELQILLNGEIDIEMVYRNTVKITDSNGAEAQTTREQVASLRDLLDEREWVKLVALANRLTFEVENLDVAIGSDSDFLQKS